VSAPSEESDPTPLSEPALSLVKSADTETATEAGDVITYSFTVTNIGNADIEDVTIAEGEFSGAGTLGEVVCPEAAALLAPGDVVVCEAEYTVVAGDLTGEALTNTATAGGIGPDGAAVESAASTAEVETVVPAEENPSEGGLAQTGGQNLLWTGALAALFVLAGAGLIVARRRV
ncbi:DUF7507 domain-containing protein, partial [Microbacterium sp. NPDC055903]